MKILFLNYEYPPIGGGAANATMHLLRELSISRPDISVDAIVSSPGKASVEQIESNINIYKLDIGKNGNLHYQRNFEILKYLFKASALINKLTDKKKYDAAHIFFAVPCGLLTLIPGMKIPYVISLRGSDVPGYSDRYKPFYPFIKPFFKTICKNASSVVANSIGLRDLAAHSLKHIDIDIIPNGVDTVFFTPSETKESKEIKIFSAGRLIPRKGYANLIKAAATLINEGLPIKIEIAGEGPELANLEKLASDLSIRNNITFSGLCSREQLRDIYRSSDIFVLPSLNEGMSNSLLEAMASGLPIVTTDTGGSTELVGDNGFIVPRGNIEALSGAIRSLATNTDKRKAFGALSRRTALTFSWKSVADCYTRLYKKAAGL